MNSVQFKFQNIGDVIQESVRTAFLAGKGKEAIKLFQDCVEGVPMNYIIGVLHNKYQMTGDESVDFKEGSSEVYQEALDDFKNKIFKASDKNYRFIDSISLSDLKDEFNSEIDEGSSLKDVLESELVHDYENEEKVDILFYKEKDLCIVCREIDEECILDKDNIQSLKDVVYKNSKDYLYIQNLKSKINEKIKEDNVELKEYTVNYFDLDGNEVEKVVNVPFDLAQAYVLNSYQQRYEEAYKLWKPISPTGMKMMNDSPFHTDLWLALDLPLNEDNDIYNSNENNFFQELILKVNTELFKSKMLDTFNILSNTKLTKFSGKVVNENSQAITDQDILVIPDASARYLEKAQKAGLVITELGGKMAHIVLVTKEDNLPILLMSKATSRFEEGDILTLDLLNRKIVEHKPKIKVVENEKSKEDVKIFSVLKKRKI